MTTALPDLERVRAFLRAACGVPGGVESLEMSYLTPGPRGAVDLLYEGQGPGDQVLRLAARRMGPAAGQKAAAAINRRYRRRPAGTPFAAGFARAALYAPDLHLLFQVFPADRGLLRLPTAADAVAMAPILERALAQRTGAARLTHVAVQVVRYKPARKCLLRYDLAWTGGAAPERPEVVYAKVARRERRARAHTTLAYLWRVADQLPFAVPEPLAVVPGLSMELAGRVPGVPLSRLAEADDFPPLCRVVGAALVRFHALPVALEWTRDGAATVARLGTKGSELAGLVPTWQARVAALTGVLTGRLVTTCPPRLQLIHHDFQGDNVLVDGRRLGLVDFEDCAMGDPADDVGSMWAQLTWLAIKAGTRRALADAGRRAFLEAYLRDAGPAFATRAATHAALHCVLYAYQCLRHPRGRGRPAQADALLAACESVLARGLP